MPTKSTLRCLPWPDTRETASLRIFCLPHAGGSANAFFSWISRYAASDTAIHPIEYPGRGTRAGEPLPRSVDELASELLDELRDMMNAGPFAILGHSLGALVGFCVAQRLEAMGGRRPSRLVLCGAEPPGAGRRAPWHALARAPLIERLRGLGAMSSRAWDNDDLVDVILPTIRADLAAAETWAPADITPVESPIIAVAGDRDVMAPSDSVAEWRLFAGGPFDFRILEGDHFFLHKHPDLVLSFARP